jgi:hypothetical protein
MFILHSVNLWGMMRRNVGIMISCMKGQGIHIEFKEKCSHKGKLCSLILQEEETSTLVVDLEEEDEVEVWVEFEVKLFSITAHTQDIWQGIVKTLVLLETTVIHSTM